MVARFQHLINYHRNNSDDLPPEELIEKITNQIGGVKTFEYLTKKNSPDSMWEDTDELARWIAARVLMPYLEPEETLRDGPEEEPEKEPEEEPEKEPEVEPEEEPEDIDLPLPFFLEGDAERLAPSGKFETPELVKPTLHPTIVDNIAYRGHWGPKEDTSMIMIAVYAFDNLDTAQNLFDQTIDEHRVSVATLENSYSKVGCPVPPDAIQETPNRISIRLPYCELERGGRTFTEHGQVKVLRLYRNTFIFIDGQSNTHTDDAKMLNFPDEMERNAIQIIDQAIERAKGKGWRE